jgi:WD40 repeat protein
MRHGRVHTLLADAVRLLLVYTRPITRGALHVYLSALVTMPSCLLFEETAPHDGHGIPLLISKRAPAWGFRETIIEALDSFANATVEAHPIPEGHQAQIQCVSLSPDGLLIASGSWDQTMRIWDAVKGTERHVIEVGDGVFSTAFSPNSRTVACGQSDGTVQLRDAASGQKKSAMMGKHAHAVDSVAFSSDGNSLASYSTEDSTTRIWDAATGVEKRILTRPIEHENGGWPWDSSVMFSTDGKSIILLEDLGFVVVKGIWDLTLDQPEYTESASSPERTSPFDDGRASYLGAMPYGGAWIRHRVDQEEPKRVCWLPQERRGKFACRGTKVCTGGPDGMITILDFSPVDLPQEVA